MRRRNEVGVAADDRAEATVDDGHDAIEPSLRTDREVCANSGMNAARAAAAAATDGKRSTYASMSSLADDVVVAGVYCGHSPAASWDRPATP